MVITGATAGVGRATARAFGKAKANVALLARGKDALEATKVEIESFEGKALALQVDVADPAQLEKAATEIEEKLGPIDIWINNAMVSVFSPLKEIKPEEFKRVTDVTYLGQVYGAMTALKHMMPRNRGSIVFVGSALAYRGIPLQSAYCGAKHGIQGFYDSLRCELLHDKSQVKVSMVELPALNTPQFGWVKTSLPNKPKPMGKIFQPEVAAKAIMHIALHPEREMYVAWPTFQSIIGDKVAPGLLDRYLAKKGYQGQQTDEPINNNRKYNLWEPVPGDHGAHGTFDKKASYKSPLLWVSINKKTVAAAAAAFVTASVAALFAFNRNSTH